MIHHFEIDKSGLLQKIKHAEILFGGNNRLKIYGKLSYKSGKKMKKQNRVFFSSEQEALNHQYRPCGHCMKIKYEEWKRMLIA
jgi:methylphosphotriester-DNA--protein-cysteine methyltransferase